MNAQAWSCATYKWNGYHTLGVQSAHIPGSYWSLSAQTGFRLSLNTDLSIRAEINYMHPC